MTTSDDGDEPLDGSTDEAPALEAARTLLRRLIQAQGFTLGEIDAKLGYARGYVSRLVHGQARLTYRHILAIMKAIELAPTLFFSTLHPYTTHTYTTSPPRELEAGLRELRGVVDRVQSLIREEPIPPTPVADAELAGRDVDDRIEAAVRAVKRNRLSSKA